MALEDMRNETYDVKISPHIDIHGYLETKSNEQINSIIRRTYAQPAGPDVEQGSRLPDGEMPQLRSL